MLLRLPSLEQPFDNDSGAIAYDARLITRGEPLYGTHHPAHHMPATYYVYASAFLLFGDSLEAVKFLLILWTIVTVYVLYRLGSLLMSKGMGLLAAVFYAFLSAHVLMWGTSAEIELFANLPRIAGVLLLVMLTARPAAAWKFALIGLLSAVAFLFKVVYISSLVLACLALLVEWWQARANGGAWRAAVTRGLWLGGGFVAGLLPVLAYFGLLGLLPRLLAVFTLGTEYVNLTTTPAAISSFWPLYPFLGLAINNVAFVIFSLAGLLLATIQIVRPGRSGPQEGAPMGYIAVWFVLSFIEAGANRTFFLHYYLLIVPPAALLAAWFLLKVHRSLKHQTWAVSRLVATPLLAALLGIAGLISVDLNFNYYRHYVGYKLNLETYQDFLLDGWPAAGSQLVRLQALAAYVREHTLPSDRIYYWSGDVQLYYLADRRCPVDIIWPLYIEATGLRERVFGPQTKYIIVDNGGDYPRPAWLYDNLAGKYTLETAIQDQDIYRRMD
jgi:hypothetical protein